MLREVDSSTPFLDHVDFWASFLNRDPDKWSQSGDDSQDSEGCDVMPCLELLDHLGAELGKEPILGQRGMVATFQETGAIAGSWEDGLDQMMERLACLAKDSAIYSVGNGALLIVSKKRSNEI